MGLAPPPDEMQLAVWANRLGKAMHELTVEDMKSAEMQSTVDFLINTLGRLEGAKDKAAVMKSMDLKNLSYVSELRKEARQRYAK